MSEEHGRDPGGFMETLVTLWKLSVNSNDKHYLPKYIDDLPDVTCKCAVMCVAYVFALDFPKRRLDGAIIPKHFEDLARLIEGSGWEGHYQGEGAARVALREALENETKVSALGELLLVWRGSNRPDSLSDWHALKLRSQGRVGMP